MTPLGLEKSPIVATWDYLETENKRNQNDVTELWNFQKGYMAQYYCKSVSVIYKKYGLKSDGTQKGK